MRIVTCGSILSVLLLLLVFQNPTVSAERGYAAADSSTASWTSPEGLQEAVEEAVDLTAGLPEDQKEMESLLHWAIEHSDKDALHEKAEAVRRDEAIKDYKERKQRVKELSDLVSQQPTETQLMQDALGVITDAEASTADKEGALAQLQELVEPIDNANDLKVLGGLEPLVGLLEEGAPSLQAGAAYVLGTAASNNEKLTSVLVKEHPQLLQQLLKMASAEGQDEASNKAMYALARLVAGPAPSARAEFYNTGGLSQLQALLGGSCKASTRVKTRAVNLVSDLIEMTANGDDTSLETWNESALAAFAAASLDLLQQSDDLHVKEKALFATRTLLLRRGPAGGAALAHEGAEAVLREVLIELDLVAEQYREHAEALQKAEGAAAAAAAGGKEGGKKAGGAGGESEAGAGSDRGESGESEEGTAEAAGQQYQYAQYVGHLCADVLHHLAVHHDEL